MAALHTIGVGRCRCPRVAPHGRAVLPCAGVAPVGGRSYQRPSLQAAAMAVGLLLATSPRAATPCGLVAGGAYARKRRPYRRQPCHGRPWLPLQVALIMAVHPCRWLGHGYRPCKGRGRRSYIPVFQIRMEKMKEVKRPPL
ncbi:hypothetical protein BHE74_00001830 [Ensete ventricosum]|nr:hypothetical protein BHE74_00001830 [Ensete ventricosum]